jgi:FkbH-like protein
VGAAVQRLATHALGEAQSVTLGRAVKRLREAGASLAPMSPFSLAILSNTTFDFIAATLPAAAARHGVALDVWLAPLGQIEQEAFNPGSELYAARRDAVLLGVDHRWLGLEGAALQADPEARVQEALERLRGVVGAIAQAGSTAIVPTLAAPPGSLFGSYDRRVARSARAMADRINAALPALCAETGAVLLDVAAVAELVGLARWSDAPAYNLYKLPFASDAVPLYCDHVGRLLGAMRGKSRKCLVLDLDNTCWGGVVGDDGLEGLCISGPEGEGFLAVQQTALDLKARGVVLAVCSKNNDETARSAFREHPDMLLRESDIAVFQANWEDKPSNLEAIARTLEIGLDALVFLDDNGAERAQVRAALPMVATPELPADPALYSATLLAAGYFEAVAFSEEDRLRSESYAANAQRAEVLSRSRNLEDYLASLDMEIGFAPFDAVNRARIAQLINKTNQFNLTTRRHTEAEVAAMERGGAAFTLQARLSDRYGDFGMIGVIIANEAAASTWEVDTWLMSCRVLGRQVEQAMLAELAAAASAAGVTTLAATYVPTPKNGMVADHYDKLGFTREAETADGVRRYSLDVASFRPVSLPFRRRSDSPVLEQA